MRARLAYIQIITCTVAWGSLGVVAKQITAGSGVITFFRLAVGATVVTAYLAVRGRLRELRPGARPVLLVTSGMVLGVHWIFQFESFRRLELAPAILIVFLGPVLMAAAAPWILRERLQPIPLLALAAAFGGIALIAVPEIDGIDGLGLASALVSAVLFAVLLLMGKLLTEHYTSPSLVVWQLSVGAVLVSPALLGAQADEVARALLPMIAIGAGYTGLLGILFFEAVRALPAQRFGVLFYLEPASAVLYGWALLDERPTLYTLGGGALIVAAGLAIVLSDRAAIAASPDLPEPAPAGP